MNLIQTLTEQYRKPELPTMNVGDTVRVTIRVKEGNRERNQAFEGTIIAKKHGGIQETITVRRISYGRGDRAAQEGTSYASFSCRSGLLASMLALSG